MLVHVIIYASLRAERRRRHIIFMCRIYYFFKNPSRHENTSIAHTSSVNGRNTPKLIAWWYEVSSKRVKFINLTKCTLWQVNLFCQECPFKKIVQATGGVWKQKHMCFVFKTKVPVYVYGYIVIIHFWKPLLHVNLLCTAKGVWRCHTSEKGAILGSTYDE